MPTIKKDWSVFVFHDAQGSICFVAMGRPARGVAPWDRLWSERLKGDTPLCHWLRTFKEQPKHVVLHSGLSKIGVEGLIVKERERLKQERCDLLGNRERGTYRNGGGLARVVMDDRGDVFESLAAAAFAHGVNPSTASRNVKRGKWSFSDYGR